MRNRVTKIVAATAFAITAVTASASAGVIVSPVGGTVDVGSTFFFSSLIHSDLANSYNHSGLPAFVSGVTNFQSYMATNPKHSTSSANEWFATFGEKSSQITYDLGSSRQVGRIAFWNEDSFGIDKFDVSYSNDGVTFSPLSLTGGPSENPIGIDYAADLLILATDTSMKFVRFSMNETCSDQGGTNFHQCSIGEVAFEVVPEPSTLAIIGLVMLSLFGMGWLRSRA